MTSGDLKRHSPARQHLTLVEARTGWLVVEKPSGISVHNDPGRDLRTLVAAMLRGDAELINRTGFIPQAEVHAPHRLDRDTSGLVLLCCSDAALTFYGQAFQAGRVGKCYLAVVHGRLALPAGIGVWSFPLSRGGAGRRHPAGRGRRRPCRTYFAALGYSRHYTLAACFPATGRRHQIRRHAKLAGHPVVGDRRYGSSRALRRVREKAGLMRLGLHAYGLDVPLPGGTERRTILSAGMPADLVDLLAADSQRAAADWRSLLAPLTRAAAWPHHGRPPGGGFV